METEIESIKKEYNPKEDPIVMDFVKFIQTEIPSLVENVILYGSRARTDFTEYSDYDFLIVIKKKDKNIKEKIYELGYSIFDIYSKLVSCMVWDTSEWNRKKEFSLGRIIHKEGIVIL